MTDIRLLTLSRFVREGAYLFDVGTDHAYLPIYLCSRGTVRGAMASDINEGPLRHARKHIEENGFSDKITTLLADGIPKTLVSGACDIVIAGMGGSLISDIIAAAEHIKRADVRLILQPMRNAPQLRAYLYENGFSIVGEALARDDRRAYEIIAAEYDGTPRKKSDIALLLGEKNIENKKDDPALFMLHCDNKAAAIEKKINGKKESGADASYEEALLALIKKEREDIL